MSGKPKVLLVGESWISTGTHIKGFNDFPTAFYEEGHEFLSTALSNDFAVEHMPAHLAPTRFPESVDSLSQYAAILLSDIGSDSLLLHPDMFLRSNPRPNRLELLEEYVAGGGGFAMIGGYMSFAGYAGRARYHRTPVEEILPVEIAPYDDRVEVPQGLTPEVVDGAHPIVDGITGQWPLLLGYNRLKEKQGGQVILRHRNDPLLVVGAHGRGRTLAFASDCAPHWGSTLFIQWDHYNRFWTQAIRWLAGDRA